MRIALGIEYQGTNYQGWQRQSNAVKSIQLELELALSKVANHKIDVICAGRTDAGVHATSQVVHFDSNANRSESQWLLGVNALLPKDIRVVWSKKVSNDFRQLHDIQIQKQHNISLVGSIMEDVIDTVEDINEQNEYVEPVDTDELLNLYSDFKLDFEYL